MAASSDDLSTPLGTIVSTTLSVEFDPDLKSVYECDTTIDSITATPDTFSATLSGGTNVSFYPQDVAHLGINTIILTAAIGTHYSSTSVNLEVLPVCNFSPILSSHTETYMIDVIADASPVILTIDPLEYTHTYASIY